ncbi:MAG: hypothetical protein CL485_02825 [Acidobacteria bacterium]|jgi:hypothetical protein|nr:hypothetical protein [Acidobacteriota bacterium]MBO08444.1 hypothetical protein [Acidobacteriota bacterium]|tara:strand:- start:505 stop:813 length:309 start_codon:yes stop_codon:yes gene_type:complete
MKNQSSRSLISLPILQGTEGQASEGRTLMRIQQSHYRPRSRNGWIAVVSFLGLMGLAQPPIVHSLANRIEPWILGVPFLYAYLLVVYIAMIGVLVWVQRRGL